MTSIDYAYEFLSTYQNYLGGGMLAIVVPLKIGGWMKSSSASLKGLESATRSEWRSLSISMSITR